MYSLQKVGCDGFAVGTRLCFLEQAHLLILLPVAHRCPLERPLAFQRGFHLTKSCILSIKNFCQYLYILIEHFRFP